MSFFYLDTYILIMKGIFMKNITVGIPRALHYYKYKTLWTTFFKELGINILLSPYTNEEIINNGRKILNNRLCLFIQIYFGHVNYLKDKVDYILMSSIDRECSCYSFLYDIVSNIFDIKILNLKIEDEEEAFLNLGKQLGINKQTILNAYKIAKKEEYKQKKINYLLDLKRLKKSTKKTLVIGKEYMYKDNFIINKLFNDSNIDFFYSNTINPDIKPYKKAILSNICSIRNEVNKTIVISTRPCVLKNVILNNKIKGKLINIEEKLDG